MANGKWFFEPQKEVNKDLADRYNGTARLVEQVIAKNDVFEKYIVQKDNEVFVVMYQMKRIDYGDGYKVLKYKSE